MANLSFVEKNKFERLFGMKSGYILDFSNREFQELVFSVMEIDIYKIYSGLSKAKILRAIIKDYDNIIVGKLLLEIMNYQKNNNLIEDIELFNECIDIGFRLIGKTTGVRKKIENVEILNEINYEEYKDMLLDVANKSETPQGRGFLFEKFLYNLFKDCNLNPRGSFKIEGEQIDGSFILHNEVYLLEAKWTNKQVNKSDLVIFNEKVSSKSGFTRGLYISFSGYTNEGVKTFSNGRKVNIVLMTVQELFIILERHIDINEAIWNKVRALAEEGECFKQL
ncbi:TPA: hypothetical protein ACF2DM_000401 [Clostridium perfringens]